MSTVTTVSSGSGMGFLFLIFLILKLTGTITWSWWWVTAPLWLPTAFTLGLIISLCSIVVVVGAIAFVVFQITEAISKKKEGK